jgi:hypothetical protein
MTTLTQDRTDLPDREDGEKVRDARPDCERCQLAGVELGNVIKRHVRFAGQGLDVLRVCSVIMRRGV